VKQSNEFSYLSPDKGGDLVNLQFQSQANQGQGQIQNRDLINSPIQTNPIYTNDKPFYTSNQPIYSQNYS
jgi:hypothetical protein